MEHWVLQDSAQASPPPGRLPWDPSAPISAIPRPSVRTAPWRRARFWTPDVPVENPSSTSYLLSDLEQTVTGAGLLASLRIEIKRVSKTDLQKVPLKGKLDVPREWTPKENGCGSEAHRHSGFTRVVGVRGPPSSPLLPPQSMSRQVLPCVSTSPATPCAPCLISI